MSTIPAQIQRAELLPALEALCAAVGVNALVVHDIRVDYHHVVVTVPTGTSIADDAATRPTNSDQGPDSEALLEVTIEVTR